MHVQHPECQRRGDECRGDHRGVDGGAAGRDQIVLSELHQSAQTELQGHPRNLRVQGKGEDAPRWPSPLELGFFEDGSGENESGQGVQ